MGVRWQCIHIHTSERAAGSDRVPATPSMEEPKQVTDEPKELEEEKGVEGFDLPAHQQQSPELITNVVTADPNVTPARPLTMAEVRQRMQEKYNTVAAAASLKKSKEREEKVKEDKKAELECGQLGGSQKSKPQDKTSAAVNTRSSSSSSRTSSGAIKKPPARSRMRPEYNPLMGDIGGSRSRWRPSARGPAGGG